jgi:hypothetical protein
MTKKFKRTCHNATLQLHCLFYTNMYEHFKETFCPALSASLFKQKFESAVSSGTLVLIFQLTRRHIPEFYNLNTHCARNVNNTRNISFTIFVDYGQKDSQYQQMSSAPHAMAHCFETLRYKPEGRGFDSP